MAFIATISLSVIGYQKRWLLRHLVFTVKERFCKKKGLTEADNFQYDAFVIYSSEDIDRVWVHLILVQELENVYGFNLCIHHRDFLGGLDIADNIEDAIRSSRKVIVIVSPSFLESRWCVREVHMTDSVDVNKLIFVMYQELNMTDDVPAIIRHLLETRTYIQWDENPDAKKLFWKKIVKALYSY
jgi:hypothetical protein